jgi:hypothetical protein
LRGLTAGLRPAPASFGIAEFFACARVKRAQAFLVSMSEVAIPSAFLASRAKKRGNFLKLQDDCASRDAGGPSRRRIMLWAAAFTHKIKWSHCYFFAAVVIGL